MNKQQRILAVISLVAGGAVGIQQAISDTAASSSTSTEQVAVEVETAVIEAAYALKELGRTPEMVKDELAVAAAVSPETVDALARRAVFSNERDPRAIRSVTVTYIVPLSSTAAAVDALAGAFCDPLALGDLMPAAHAECLSSRAVLEGGVDHCDGSGVVVGRSTELLMTPPQAERAAAAMAGIAIDPADAQPCQNGQGEGEGEGEGDPPGGTDGNP